MENFGRCQRFQRSEMPPAMRLTDRDAEIIQHVHTNRFLRSDHITALIGATSQPILRRLNLLYHARYLDRPRAQLDHFYQGGSGKMVYGLGNRGADLLQQHFGIARPRVDWSAKNQSVKPVFLQHALSVSDVMVRLECACRRNRRLRLLQAHEVATALAPGLTGYSPRFQWNVTFTHDGEPRTLGIIPDKVFALQFADRPSGKDIAYFFLESDRATMPVVRRSLRRTSFFQKMLAYYETWRQQLHTSLFKFPRFRVLTVTTTAERTRHILETNRVFNDGNGSGLFLFTDCATLSASTSDILNIPMTSGRGEVARLIDR